MPISKRLLQRGANRFVATSSWVTIADWLYILACHPVSTPLVDFGQEAKEMRVGATALNWFLMDLLGLRADWYRYGWLERDPLWLLINPLRYLLLGHQPRRPYAEDVRDYLAEHRAYILNNTLGQHPYFACVPLLYQHETDNQQAIEQAASAPWSRVAVLNRADEIIGMVWAPGPFAHILPPILRPPSVHPPQQKAWN